MKQYLRVSSSDYKRSTELPCNWKKKKICSWKRVGTIKRTVNSLTLKRNLKIDTWFDGILYNKKTWIWVSLDKQVSVNIYIHNNVTSRNRLTSLLTFIYPFLVLHKSKSQLVPNHSINSWRLKPLLITRQDTKVQSYSDFLEI